MDLDERRSRWNRSDGVGDFLDVLPGGDDGLGLALSAPPFHEPDNFGHVVASILRPEVPAGDGCGGRSRACAVASIDLTSVRRADLRDLDDEDTGTGRAGWESGGP